MLCAAMTVTMGSVPALAEDLGGDYYEIAFSDDAENFENPAETEPGIEESSEAEAVPEEAGYRYRRNGCRRLWNRRMCGRGWNCCF